MKPIFILGMGAQKAGTSWLHSNLSKNDNINMGFLKEYHIWDYVFSDLCKKFKAPVRNPDNSVDGFRRLMQKNSSVYTQYFQSLIADSVNVTGDITPSYCLINRNDLQKINALLTEAGFDVKVIFLMRDPVQRIWSAVRMEKRNLLRIGKKLSSDFCEKRVLQYIKNDEHIERSNYKSTIENIESVFDENNVHIEFYEKLFTPESIDRLNSFLNVSLDKVSFTDRVNISEPELIAPYTHQTLRQFLAPQYEFCKRKFPETNELWED